MLYSNEYQAILQWLLMGWNDIEPVTIKPIVFWGKSLFK